MSNRKLHRDLVVVASAGLILLLANTAHAQVPPTGYVNGWQGITPDGRCVWIPVNGQCVHGARNLSGGIWQVWLPALGANGVAADYWVVKTPGYGRVGNTGTNLPPRFSFIVWGRELGGTGHVAMVLGVVDQQRRIVRVIDSNWSYDQRGQVHDVTLNSSKVLGWLVRQ